MDATGDRPARLIGQLLRNAGVEAADVRYVLGHGNGVMQSDASEINYMRRVFGDDASHIPLLSTKPIYGHTLGASVAVNVAAASLMAHHKFLIPTLNVDEKRTSAGVTHQPNRGKADSCDLGVVMGFGMGGQYATLLVGGVKA
ncbi:MAG TPA: hypothetical protein VI565_09915 [Burkholderiales bacterium]|nr:hypothetical protein [Burkholderiales bacterium]